MNVAALVGWLEPWRARRRAPPGRSWRGDRAGSTCSWSAPTAALYHKAWDGTAWQPGATTFEHLGGVIA